MKAKAACSAASRVLTHGTLNHPVAKGEQGACSFRCLLHHIVETTGLTSVCCSEGIENERAAVKKFFYGILN